MAKGVYKPGQGYWVRTMSAVFAGALILAGAAWAYAEAAVFEDALPVERWTMTTSPTSAEPPETGERVELLMSNPTLDPEGEAAEDLRIGEHKVLAVRPGAERGVYQIELSPNLGETARVGLGARERDVTASEAEELVAADGSFRAELRQRIRTTTVPVTYVQAGVAIGIILAGAAGLYWFVGLNRKSVEFLIATDGEMRKVNWSTRREIIGSTQVVIVAAFLIAGILFLIDIGFGSFFKWIDVLQG